MIGVSSVLTTGDVQVVTTSGRGHTPEEIADMCLNKVMSVADTAPQPIKDQARAFRDRLRSVLVHYMKQAARSDRTTLVNRLREAGHHDAAELIFRL